MLTLIIRSVLIYVILLIAVRVMGKRQIGDMQPFELVATLVIADLATIPMSDVSIPIIYGVVPLLTLVVLHHIFTIINRKSIYFRKIFNGKPVIVINQDGIDYKALKSLNMTINDLTEGLRMSGCFNLGDVAYAIVETNGNISVMQKGASTPPSAENMKIAVEDDYLQIILINEGKLLVENMEYIGLDIKSINNLLKKQGIDDIKKVLILSINKGGEAYLQEKGEAAKVITIKEDKQ